MDHPYGSLTITRAGCTVAVLLGHSSTVTTNKYYAKMRQKRAVETVLGMWNTEPFGSSSPEENKIDENGEQEGGQSSEEPDSEKEPPENYQKLTSIVDHIESSNLSSMNNNFKNSKLLKLFSIVFLCSSESSVSFGYGGFNFLADAKINCTLTHSHTHYVNCAP